MDIYGKSLDVLDSRDITNIFFRDYTTYILTYGLLISKFVYNIELAIVIPSYATFFFIYVILEILFYFRFRYLYHHCLTYIKKLDSHPEIDLCHIREAMLKTLEYEEVIGDTRKWFIEYFNNCDSVEDIYMDDVRDAIAEIFFTKLKFANLTPDEQNLTNEYIQMLELSMHHKFKSGKNAKITNRLLIHPLEAYHRPLLMYLCVAVMHFFTKEFIAPFMGLKCMSFGQQKVWYRLASHHNKLGVKKKPHLFLHGLGIDLPMYLLFIYKLLQRDEDVFILEVEYVSLSIKTFLPFYSYINYKKPYSTAETVGVLQDIEAHFYDAQQFKKKILELDWTFIAHSYGSYISGALYQYMRVRTDNFATMHEPRMVLLDPVSFYGIHPQINKLLMKNPPSPDLKFTKYAFTTELMIGTTMRLYLHLHECFLWPKEFLINRNVQTMSNGCYHEVLLCGKDVLVPVDEIRIIINYENDKKENADKRIGLTYYEELGHGNWLVSPTKCEEIVNQIIFQD